LGGCRGDSIVNVFKKYYRLQVVTQSDMNAAYKMSNDGRIMNPKIIGGL